MKLKKLNQLGDTIVEVLLAVGIVGLAIVTAYGVASLSLKQGRQAQERSEALKIAESQIEHLKALSTKGNTTIYNNGLFCLSSATVPRVSFGATYEGGAEIAPLTNDSLGNYPAPCVRDSSNSPVVGGFYHIVIKGRIASDNRYHFTVAVRWFSLSGTGKDEVKIDYRVVRS